MTSHFAFGHLKCQQEVQKTVKKIARLNLLPVFLALMEECWDAGTNAVLFYHLFMFL